MRPRERQETGEQDLFRSRQDRIIFGWPRLPAVANAADGRLGASQRTCTT